MRISGITIKQYNPHFKQNNDIHVFGDDDEISKERRDYIRNWREKYYTPYQSLYDKECRKSEFEIKQLISELVQKPIPTHYGIMSDLDIVNFRRADFGIYRGGMIGLGEDIDKVSKLHEAGIRTLIPLDSGNYKLETFCERFGMKYLPMRFNRESSAFENPDRLKSDEMRYATSILNLDEKKALEYVNKTLSSHRSYTRIFINQFIGYIQAMQKGNVFIGCEFGTTNTDTAMMFDYLFNPKMNHSSCLNWRNEYWVKLAENLYKNLTADDKLKMGWTKDFEQTFAERLEDLKNRV